MVSLKQARSSRWYARRAKPGVLGRRKFTDRDPFPIDSEIRADLDFADGEDRPLVYGDCLAGGVNEQRPCPWVSCRHHLAWVEQFEPSGLRVNGLRVIQDWDDGRPSCSLDVANNGEAEREEIGKWWEMTHERVRQIEEDGLRRLRFHGQTFRRE
jgi:hypothetical protein